MYYNTQCNKIKRKIVKYLRLLALIAFVSAMISSSRPTSNCLPGQLPINIVASEMSATDFAVRGFAIVMSN